MQTMKWTVLIVALNVPLAVAAQDTEDKLNLDEEPKPAAITCSNILIDDAANCPASGKRKMKQCVQDGQTTLVPGRCLRRPRRGR